MSDPACPARELPAGDKRTAEAAELRKAGTDQPQSKARRGFAAGERQRRNCGRTAEQLRKLSVPVPASSAARQASAPALVRPLRPQAPREASPPPPAERGAAAWAALRVTEPDPTGRPAADAGCQVLTHPAFDRPPVPNERRRGPKRGAVSLAAARAERAARDFEARRLAMASAPAHDLRAAPHAPRAAGPQEPADAVIGAALAMLDAKLRQPGVALTSPQRVREFLALHLAGREREAVAVLFLDAQHALIEFAVMFEGTLSCMTVHPREIARRALTLNAGAVILAHNHPSGNPEPSRPDQTLTAALKSALGLVDVRVLDHLIVGRLKVVSMAERGMV